jgi:hypothetical protein
LALAGTWLIGRTFLSGREVGRTARRLTLIKDGLVIGATATGVGSLVVGSMLAKQAEKGEPIGTGESAARASKKTRILQQTENGLGFANLALAGGIAGITAILAMASGRSSKWSVVSRLLP